MTMQSSSRFKIALAVTGALSAIGFITYVFQLMNGLGITGMSNANSWGLYLTCFMFFVGLSAGGLIVASSASIFHVTEYKKVAVPAVILSTACICIAGMLVLVDLGGIARIWRLITGPNFSSPLLWDVCVITCYLIINVLYLVFMCSKKADPHKVEIVSRFALPCAILVHSVTAWIFGLQISREAWYSTIMAPLFVASAMDSGLAALLLVLIGMNKTGTFRTDGKLIANLSGLLATFIAVDGFFVGSEVLTMGYPGASGAETLSIMTTGVTAPYFWFEIICGIIIPFAIIVFAKNRQRIGLVVISCVGVVLGVFCKRVWLMFTAFYMPNIYGADGISLGTVSAQQGGVGMWALTGGYAPTVPEVIITIGVISLGALAFLILIDRLVAGNRPAPGLVFESSAKSVAE